MIPVYRLREGKEFLHLNEYAFVESARLLKNNEAVLIFIEGKNLLKGKGKHALKKKKNNTFITSMYSTHRDRAPAGAFAKLNNKPSQSND